MGRFRDADSLQNRDAARAGVRADVGDRRVGDERVGGDDRSRKIEFIVQQKVIEISAGQVSAARAGQDVAVRVVIDVLFGG